MKLIAQVKLLPTVEQTEGLRRTIESVNAACGYMSEVAWERQTFRRFDLHHLVYREVRARFRLAADMTCLAISKVAAAYKLDRKCKRRFRKNGAIAYHPGVLSWNWVDETVSIWTLDGRQRIPFVCGDRQRDLLTSQKGETDLVLVGGKLFLSATCEVEQPEPFEAEGVLGIDVGVVNIAVDSDGECHSASFVNNVRFRNRRLRRKLHLKGTRAAKRRLKALAGKERRFAKDVNHTISKHLVTKAQGTHRAIAMEDLTGLRERVTVTRHQRVTLASWSFYQLRCFIQYKAQRVGVPFVLVDPRNTSRTCPRCGVIDKANRKSQSVFSCVVCGFAGLADHVAACNIASRAAISRPYVARDEAKADST